MPKKLSQLNLDLMLKPHSTEMFWSDYSSCLELCGDANPRNYCKSHWVCWLIQHSPSYSQLFEFLYLWFCAAEWLPISSKEEKKIFTPQNRVRARSWVESNLCTSPDIGSDSLLALSPELSKVDSQLLYFRQASNGLQRPVRKPRHASFPSCTCYTRDQENTDAIMATIHHLRIHLCRENSLLLCSWLPAAGVSVGRSQESGSPSAAHTCRMINFITTSRWPY